MPSSLAPDPRNAQRVCPCTVLVSNTGMDIPAEIDTRLMNLEVQASYADDLLEQLSEQNHRQQQQIDWLVQELRQMRERLPEAAPGASRNLRDEIPPHY